MCIYIFIYMSDFKLVSFDKTMVLVLFEQGLRKDLPILPNSDHVVGVDKSKWQQKNKIIRNICSR